MKENEINMKIVVRSCNDVERIVSCPIAELQ